MRQTYSTTAEHQYGRNLEVDLFAERYNRSWNDIAWSRQVRHEYNILGQKELTLNYFAPTSTRTLEVRDGDWSYDVTFDLSGEEKSIQRFEYTVDGNFDKVSQSGWVQASLEDVLKAQFTAQGTHQVIDANLTGLLSESTSHGLNTSTYFYDDAGRMERMKYNNHKRTDTSDHTTPSQYMHTFSYTYTGRQQYLESRVSGSSNTEGYKPTTTTSFYDASGNRYAIEEKSTIEGSKISARYFDTSADGKLVKKVSGTQNRTHLGALPSVPVEGPINGGGTTKPNGEETPITFPNNPPTNVPGLPEERPTVAHTIRFTESKSTHWEDGEKEMRSTTSHYLHAGGNYLGEMKENGEVTVKQAHFAGISAKAPGSAMRHQVTTGETLQSIAVAYYGNPDYWYIIADVNGISLEAGEPLVAGQTLTIPEQANNANRFDTFTAYNVAEQIGDTTPSLPFVPPPPEAACNMVAMIIVMVVTAIATAGAGLAMAGTALGAGGSFSAVGAGLAAAAGSVAGQLTGMALGVQEEFSWGQVAVAGLSAGVTNGLVGDLGTEAGYTAKLIGERALRGAVEYGTQHIASKMVGEPSSFSWANMAASAASSAVMPPPSRYGEQTNIMTDVVKNIAGSGVAYATKKLVNNEGSWNGKQVVADAFGNAIGNSIAAGMQREQAKTNEVKETVAKAVENGATPQQAVQQVAQKIASENGGSISGGTVSMGGKSLGNGTDYSVTNAEGQTGHFDLSSVSTVQDGYDMIGYLSDHLRGTPNMGMMLGSATSQIIGRTQTHHDNQIKAMHQRLDASWDAAVRRGEAMYDAGVRARPQMGVEFNLEAHLAADNAMWGAGKARAAAIRNGWDYTKQVVSHALDPDNLANIGYQALDKHAEGAFWIGDKIVTGLVDATTLVTDPGAIFDLEARTDQVIKQGYLPKGENLSYRMANEIYGRGLNDFILRVDGRVVKPVGSGLTMAMPWPVDDLKVYGSVRSPDGIKIFDDSYDFIDGATGTLDQYIDPNRDFIQKAIIYSRNKLNHIAYPQHSPTGSPYKIQFTYTDNDLIYGRNNFAPWKPDIDPSYARPYASYLNQ
ncbi:LysM peptidoglycan-binding domain-containing protein [Flocculibacter collagenilyticus]|uniref:LysM peptidoglycan-binding domain-containing protein n=1 Tax=Flocculibacter collagenilyticus TaxID=2744479 RepID=UPI0018F5D676|nr:LysM peptidoglycan-binding domain-containing protein [Flocculibacter collagenilyticus]